MKLPIKEWRICFERVSGDHVNDAKVFQETVLPLIADGKTEMRFGGYIILDAGILFGLFGHPCWQALIPNIPSFDIEDYLENFAIPDGYAIHVFAAWLGSNEELYQSIR